MAHALGVGHFPKPGLKGEFVVPNTEALKHTAEFSDEWQLVYSHDRNWCRRLRLTAAAAHRAARGRIIHRHR